MPARTDQYFPPEDSEVEVKHLKKGELRVIETVWGHIAGGKLAKSKISCCSSVAHGID